MLMLIVARNSRYEVTMRIIRYEVFIRIVFTDGRIIPVSIVIVLRLHGKQNIDTSSFRERTVASKSDIQDEQSITTIRQDSESDFVRSCKTIRKIVVLEILRYFILKDSLLFYEMSQRLQNSKIPSKYLML